MSAFRSPTFHRSRSRVLAGGRALALLVAGLFGVAGGPALAQVPPANPAQPTTPGEATAAPQAKEPAGRMPANEAELQKWVEDYLKRREEEAKKKAPDKDREWYAVGSELSFNGNWSNGLVFQTPNKDWTIHLGGRLQFEPVFWSQPSHLKGPPPGNGGIPASGRGDGVGPLDDGMFFRRVRLRSDGVGYELVEYTIEIDFEQLNLITYDHMWVGFKELPFIGTLRVGQHKVPQGLEMMGSDYHLTFLERSSLADAFWTLFAPGVFLANTYFDQNVTFQTMFHRIQPLGFYNADFGDGDYASTSRLTFTPVYADGGRCLVHLGGSYQWRHGDLGRTIIPGGTGNTFADTQQVARFRARPELRDATGVTFPFGDSGRFVDTGFLLTDDVHTVSPEFLWIWGPFSMQAEGAWAFAHDVRSVYPAAALGAPRGTTMFWGGYIQASYFLTGENRGYDRRFGTFDRPKVQENFFLVRGEDGQYHFGLGAWEIGYRYSYLDLNDNGVNGGQLGQHTVGLNWYFNDNFKVQFNYLNINRNVAAPAQSGTAHGFGMLAQWYF
jgi:phosphate-selective porin OprO/OprP